MYTVQNATGSCLVILKTQTLKRSFTLTALAAVARYNREINTDTLARNYGEIVSHTPNTSEIWWRYLSRSERKYIELNACENAATGNKD